MLSTFIFSILGAGASGANSNPADKITGGADIIYPLFSAASIFIGGIGTVMLFMTLFSYFLGAGDEEKMAKSHSLLMNSIVMIVSSVILFFLAKMFS